MSSNRRAKALTVASIAFYSQAMIVGGAHESRAGDLNSPFALEAVDTLPRNVRNPRFINVFSSVTAKFGDGGVSEGLGTPLFKPVTLTKMAYELEKLEGPVKSQSLRELAKNSGLREDAVLGNTTGEVNTFANVKVAAIAWGISDRFTLAGVLPIVHVDVSASTGFSPVSGGDNYAKLQIGASEYQQASLAHEIALKTDDAVNRKLTRLGYQTIPTHQTIDGVGDAQLIGKYRIYDDGVNGIALKGTVMFPTGIASNPDKALDIPTGEGRFGAALGAIYDRKLPWGLRWNSYGGYTALLPRTVTKRLPTSVEDGLSSDKDDVFEYTRSRLIFGTGVDHFFEKVGLIVGGGYTYQFMTRANYATGTAYSAERYQLLGDQLPLEALHSVMATAAFSTIDWYRHKKFIYPMQIGVSYAHPIAGRNAPASDLIAGELVVFF